MKYYYIDEMFSNEEMEYLIDDLKLDIKFDENRNEPDQAAYAGKEIFITKYSSREMALLCIFHEYGHILCNSKLKLNNIYTSGTMFSESIAWYEGMLKLREVEHKFSDVCFDLDDYYGKCNDYIRQCMASYQN